MKPFIPPFVGLKFKKNSRLLAAGLLFCLLPGCGGKVDTAERRVVMVFVDISLSSLPERENYKQHFEKIISALQPGDVIAGGKIIDLTIADFTPIFNVQLPAFDFWNDNRTQHHKLVQKLTGQMFSSVDSVLDSRGKIEKSEIISSFILCEQFMRNKSGKKTLVILSDMMECSAEYNFAQDEINAAYIEEAMRTLRAKGRLPNLRNVEVWAIGAYASQTEKFFTVQNFWERYIKETGATGRSYSHTLLDFD